jgi:hypothetical protein
MNQLNGFTEGVAEKNEVADFKVQTPPPGDFVKLDLAEIYPGDRCCEVCAANSIAISRP